MPCFSSSCFFNYTFLHLCPYSSEEPSLGNCALGEGMLYGSDTGWLWHILYSRTIHSFMLLVPIIDLSVTQTHAHTYALVQSLTSVVFSHSLICCFRVGTHYTAVLEDKEQLSLFSHNEVVFTTVAGVIQIKAGWVRMCVCVSGGKQQAVYNWGQFFCWKMKLLILFYPTNTRRVRQIMCFVLVFFFFYKKWLSNMVCDLFIEFQRTFF